MVDTFKVGEQLPALVDRIVASYKSDERTHYLNRTYLPSRQETIEIVQLLLELAYPGYHGRQRLTDLVRDGWPREAALKSVTLHPARLLGIGERFGSIEKGKEADFVFLDGDPLDPFARVRKVMIAGEIIHTVEGDVK